MAETPDQQRVTRPRAAWESRLDVIDARLDALAAQVTSVLDALATDRAERRSATSPADVSHELGLLSDRVSDVALDSAVNREILQRLDGTASALADSVSALTRSVETVQATLDDVRSAVVSGGASDATAASLRGVIDQIDSLDRRMVSRSDIDDLRHRVEQSEVSLADQAMMIGTALRRRIDDQRAAADEIGAQLANLMATSSDSVDLPDKVRREVGKEIQELAEHLGVALSDLRVQLSDGTAKSLPALTTGLDRISGRIEADAQRLSQTVSSAQAANDERMRRLDSQVTELRQRLELLRLSQPLGSRPRADN